MTAAELMANALNFGKGTISNVATGVTHGFDSPEYHQSVYVTKLAAAERDKQSAVLVGAALMPFVPGVTGLIGKAGAKLVTSFAPGLLVGSPQLPALPVVQPSRSAQMYDDSGSFDWSGLVTGATNALLAIREQKQQMAMAAPMAAAPVIAAGSRLLPSIFGGASTLIGGAVRATAGVIRSVAGKITGFIVGGRRISRAQGVALAKRVGLEAAAVALGITTVEMAQAIMDDTAGRRRGRGVTAAQIKTTRRTIRTVVGLHRQIASACSPVARRSSRSSARKPFISVATKCK